MHIQNSECSLLIVCQLLSEDMPPPPNSANSPHPFTVHINSSAWRCQQLYINNGDTKPSIHAKRKTVKMFSPFRCFSGGRTERGKGREQGCPQSLHCCAKTKGCPGIVARTLPDLGPSARAGWIFWSVGPFLARSCPCPWPTATRNGEVGPTGQGSLQ